jgi:hypothetical protein
MVSEADTVQADVAGHQSQSWEEWSGITKVNSMDWQALTASR